MRQLNAKRMVRVIVKKNLFVEVSRTKDLIPMSEAKNGDEIIREVRLDEFGQYPLSGAALDKYQRRFRHRTPTLIEVQRMEQKYKQPANKAVEQAKRTCSINIGIALEEAMAE